MLLAALYAFFQEHQRCGELDSAVKGDRVRMGVYVRRGHQSVRRR